VETGIGDRISDKGRAMRAYEGPWILPALETAGFYADSVDAIAVSHLHYDHAGGVLKADGTRAFPRARLIAQQAEWDIALAENPRLVASYDQPELRLVRDLGAESAANGEVEILPGVSVIPTGGHSAGHQGVIVRGRDRTVAFFGDLAMRPWSANPKWVTAFDDFPLTSVAVKVELFTRAAEENWTIVLSHEPLHPVGRLIRDRDRFTFETTV
jgi:glyoxylase-like metal-dependent hydrolase (beta-lactamase superfamily II)